LRFYIQDIVLFVTLCNSELLVNNVRMLLNESMHKWKVFAECDEKLVLNILTLSCCTLVDIPVILHLKNGISSWWCSPTIGTAETSLGFWYVGRRDMVPYISRNYKARMSAKWWSDDL